MWQFKAHHFGCILNTPLASAFIFLINLDIFPQALQIAQISVSQKQHLILGLTELLVSRIIFLVLLENVLGSW